MGACIQLPGKAGNRGNRKAWSGCPTIGRFGISLWKKVLLFLCAFPLAIIGNALRVVSIFVIAEYGDADWASTTWHDWSGLLLFYPFSLFLLLVIHSVLEGGLPWRGANRRKIRRTSVSKNQPEPAGSNL